jgi:hypothetical protein
MKKNNPIKIVFILLSSLVLSCSSNENSNEEGINNPTSNSIIGKWIWTSRIKDGITTPANPSTNGCPRNYIEFKENNTYVEVHYNPDNNCSIKSYPGGNYVKKENIIKYPPSTTSDEEIIELTKEKMKLLDKYGVITLYEKKL